MDDRKWLRLSGIAEGLSFLVLLLVAMPLKYMAGKPEAVKIIGSLHGGLFIIYAVLVLAVARNHQWPARLIGLGLLAAFLPLGPFWFDAKLKREGWA